MKLTSKAKIKILTITMDKAIELINYMEKNEGNHFILEYLFNQEEDSLETRLIHLNNERQTNKEE